MNIQDWAESYIRLIDDGGMLNSAHPDYSAAHEFFTELTGPIAEKCWEGILAVVQEQPSENVLGQLAAGPMEDLLYYSGDDFIERIETEARRNPDFRKMLHGIWRLDFSDSLWARIEQARGPSAA